MNEGSQRSPTVVSNDGDIDAFLQAVRTAPPATRGRGRLLFALDATMSREGTWDQAAAVQADLFREAGRVGGLSVQLMWFRGVGEFHVYPWTAEPADLVREMSARPMPGRPDANQPGVLRTLPSSTSGFR